MGIGYLECVNNKDLCPETQGLCISVGRFKEFTARFTSKTHRLCWSWNAGWGPHKSGLMFYL